MSPFPWHCAWEVLASFLDAEDSVSCFALQRSSWDSIKIGDQLVLAHVPWLLRKRVRPRGILSTEIRGRGSCLENTKIWPNLRRATWLAELHELSQVDLPSIVSPRLHISGLEVSLSLFPYGHPLSRKSGCALYLESRTCWRGSFRLAVGGRIRLYLHEFRSERCRWGDADFGVECEEDSIPVTVELLEIGLGPWPVREMPSAVHILLEEHDRRRKWSSQGDGLLSDEWSGGQLLWCPRGMGPDEDEPWWAPQAAFYLVSWGGDCAPTIANVEFWVDGVLDYASPAPTAVHPGLGGEKWTPAIFWNPPGRSAIEVRLRFGNN